MNSWHGPLVKYVRKRVPFKLKSSKEIKQCKHTLSSLEPTPGTCGHGSLHTSVRDSARLWQGLPAGSPWTAALSVLTPAGHQEAQGPAGELTPEGHGDLSLLKEEPRAARRPGDLLRGLCQRLALRPASRSLFVPLKPLAVLH